MDNDRHTEALIGVFNQNWSEARHSEKQKYWYGSIYSAIVAGVLVLFGTGVFDDSNSIVPAALLIFLLLLTLTGIIIIIKTGLAFFHHSVQAHEVAKTLDVADRNSGIYGTPLYPHTEINTNLLLSVGPWYLATYLIVFSALLGNALLLLGVPLSYSAVVSAIVLFLSSGVVYVYSVRKMRKMREILQNRDARVTDRSGNQTTFDRFW